MLVENIINLRKKNKLSQEALARKANISCSALIKIENNINIDPRMSTITKLANALEVSLDELVGRKFKSSKK